LEKDGLLRIFNEEDMTELEQLKNKVTQLHYPPTMLKINGEIEGVGFFPGATGMIGMNVIHQHGRILGNY